MQKKFSFSATLILILILALALSASTALAQGDPTANITWSSAYQVQNLSANPATLTITYYEQGTTTEYAGSATIPANSSITVFPFNSGDGIGQGPTTFNGSVVLSSDQEIAAILNTQSSSSPFYGASTNGFSQGATSIFLPLIACNNAGFDTWFNIQNVGSSDASVTVNYVPGSSGNSGTSDSATIAPNRAKTFDQNANTTLGTQKCAATGGLGTKFVGGATVSSDQPIVASVMFLGTGNIKAVQGYNGFTGGSTSLNMPLIMANNSSFYTAMQIQNTGTSGADITVTYGANTVTGGNNPIVETWNIPVGGSQTIINTGGVSAYSKNDWTTVGKYIGGATVTQATNPQPLVAIVNQNSSKYTSLGSSYEAFDPASATATINLPLIVANNSGFNTSFQVQALSNNTQVIVTYSENTVEAGEIPVSNTFTLNANQSKTLIQNGPVGDYSANDWNAIGKYIGSAKIVATGGNIIAIANFNGPATGDTFFTYDGFNAQ